MEIDKNHLVPAPVGRRRQRSAWRRTVGAGGRPSSVRLPRAVAADGRHSGRRSARAVNAAADGRHKRSVFAYVLFCFFLYIAFFLIYYFFTLVCFLSEFK